jgi:uncharacterized protein (DUF2147 family)
MMYLKPTRNIHCLLFATILAANALSATVVRAADLLPGLWEQIDDKTGKVQGLVRISKLPDNSYEGIVEKVIPEPGEDPNPKCEKCQDHRRDKPVLGMQIITGLKRADDTTYNEGLILDPDEGKTYRLKISVRNNGATLDVRGYLGISLFGRSQTWRRAKISAPVK